jgi:hypothetical protein
MKLFIEPVPNKERLWPFLSFPLNRMHTVPQPALASRGYQDIDQERGICSTRVDEALPPFPWVSRLI